MNNGFSLSGDADHLENAELQSLLKGLKLENFDPYHVIRTPSEDKSRDTTPISFRMHRFMAHAIDRLHGNGERFKNRTEVLLHFCALGLLVEQQLRCDEKEMRVLLDPTILKIKQLDRQVNLTSIDDIIAVAHGIRRMDGPQQLRETLDDLRVIREICVENELWSRKSEVDELISRYDMALKDVDGS